MAITPGAGYMIDPNNPNSVIPIGTTAQSQNLGSYNTGTAPTANMTYGAVNTQPTTYSAPQPVPVLSSQSGLNTLNTNTQNLQKIETSYAGPSIVDFLNSAGQDSSFGNREQLAKTAGIQNYTGTADQNTQLLEILRSPLGSPLQGAMVNDINKAVSGGGLTGDQMTGLKSLQSSQDAIITAAANARAALNNSSYVSMNDYIKRAQQQEQTFAQQLSDYYKAVAPLRQRQMELLSPGAREQELGRQLQDIRAQADAFNLQTEEDKLAEYQGQTLGFAGGRAAALDFKASFKRQEMALREKNLLLSLGMEQELRQKQADGVSMQLGFLADDFQMQTKVQERLSAMEDDIFAKSQQLQGESKSTLLSILDQLQGIDPMSMPQQSLANLEQLAAQAGLPFDLVLQAMQTQYARQTFEDAVKPQTSTDGGGDSGHDLTAGERKQLAELYDQVPTYPNADAALRDLELHKQAIIAQLGQQSYDALVAEIKRHFSQSKINIATAGQGASSTIDFSKFTLGSMPSKSTSDDDELDFDNF